MRNRRLTLSNHLPVAGAMVDDIRETMMLFSDAAKTASVPLNVAELESIALKIAFSRRLLANTTRQESGLPQLPKHSISESMAINAAHAFRASLQVDHFSPLFDLPQLAGNRLTVLVYTARLSACRGAFAILGNLAFVFVSLDAAEPLYSCARGLGHLLAAWNSPRGNACAVIDPSTEKGIVSSTRGRLRFADFFAGQVLVPPQGIGIALKKVRQLLEITQDGIGEVELLYLSRIFGVSFTVAAGQCEKSGLLPRGGAKAFCKFLAEKFGGPEARASALGLPPRPDVKLPIVPEVVITAAVEHARSGSISLEDAAIALSLPPAELLRAAESYLH